MNFAWGRTASSLSHGPAGEQAHPVLFVSVRYNPQLPVYRASSGLLGILQITADSYANPLSSQGEDLVALFFSHYWGIVQPG